MRQLLLGRAVVNYKETSRRFIVRYEDAVKTGKSVFPAAVNGDDNEWRDGVLSAFQRWNGRPRGSVEVKQARINRRSINSYN